MLTDERVTPDWLYHALDQEFDFRLDAAASSANTKCHDYCGLDPIGPQGNGTTCHGDGLAVPWAETLALGGHSVNAVWCNPPYSRGSIAAWCHKAEIEAGHGATSVLLLPGDTSTAYFHRYVLRHERRWLNRRLSFEGAPRDSKGRLAPAKFGSVLVLFRPTHKLWTFGG